MRALKFITAVIGALLLLYILLPKRSQTSFIQRDDDKESEHFYIPLNDLQYSNSSSKQYVPLNNHIPLNDLQYSNSSSKQYVPLTHSIINQVKFFIFFLGHARSGHSIVGSILDAHPHIVLAHEAKIFYKLQLHAFNEKVSHYSNKSMLFNMLWNNSFYSSVGGLRTEESKATRKGYSLSIDGLYQGTFVPPIQVIGDKCGGKTTAMILANPQKWEEVFFKLKSLLDIPIKVIHVIRNPFDNIATAALYKSKGFKITKVKEKNRSQEIDTDLLQQHIAKYFRFCEAIQQVKKEYHLNVMEVHGSDLIENPKDTILRMCSFLEVSCSDRYLEICSNKLFKSESKTRYKVKWTKRLISIVQDSIMKFDSLKRYSFDS